MNKVDVIGIGAINFDYIYTSPKTDNKENKNKIDDGEESFIKQHVFDERIEKIDVFSTQLHTQIGGSSLLAIRTLKSMCSQLKTAYVGVYGQIPSFAKNKNLPQTSEELKNELSEYIDDTSWLFYEKEMNTGCALVKLFKKKRQFINVLPGANDTLLEHIEKKGRDLFVSFLSSAKWIHLTSLASVYQFKVISECIREAKDINPALQVSVDPGYDYTKNHWKTLKSILPIANYLFLSRTEFSNLTQNTSLSLPAKATVLGKELINIDANPQIIIIKGKTNTVLLSLIEKHPFIRTYHHKKIPLSRIKNDTGAGDAFAGGFIAGMLSPEMLSHQPAPIELAMIAANTRLKTKEWPTEFKQNAIDYFKRNMKEEEQNRKQFFYHKLKLLKNPLLDFIIGIIVGLVVHWLLQIIG